jgi:hypothetical protein
MAGRAQRLRIGEGDEDGEVTGMLPYRAVQHMMRDGRIARRERLAHVGDGKLDDARQAFAMCLANLHYWRSAAAIVKSNA